VFALCLLCVCFVFAEHAALLSARAMQQHPQYVCHLVEAELSVTMFAECASRSVIVGPEGLIDLAGCFPFSPAIQSWHVSAGINIVCMLFEHT